MTWLHCLDFPHPIVCFRRISRSSRQGGYQAGSAQVIHLQGVLRFDVVVQLRGILREWGRRVKPTKRRSPCDQQYEINVVALREGKTCMLACCQGSPTLITSSHMASNCERGNCASRSSFSRTFRRVDCSHHSQHAIVY